MGMAGWVVALWCVVLVVLLRVLLTVGDRGLVLRAGPDLCGIGRCGGGPLVWSGMMLRLSGVEPIGRLGPLGCVGYPTCTCGLSTWWSSTALRETWF